MTKVKGLKETHQQIFDSNLLESIESILADPNSKWYNDRFALEIKTMELNDFRFMRHNNRLLKLFQKDDLTKSENRYLWQQAIYEFPNGYGASVVRHGGSYGRQFGLWELGVLLNGELNYDTPVTSDVLGSLTPSQVIDVLDLLEEL